MKIMNRNAWIGAVSVLAVTACTQEEMADGTMPSAQEMRIYAETAARTEENETATGSSADDAVFLFWDFGDVLSGTTTPNPLHVKEPEHTINTYKRPNSPYNTGERYPDGNRRVMATGYAPSTLIPATRSDDTKDYETLTIPADGLCKTDVLTSVEPIVASAALPFDREGGETLQFMHAQSKVIFQGKLAENMGKFIQNVRIELASSLVATQVVWDREKSLYVPQAKETEAYIVAQQGDDQLSKEKAEEIGEAYIVPEQTTLPVTITVKKSEDVGFTESEEITFPATLSFDIQRNEADDWDKGKDANKLYANEAYTFTIVFSEEGIELVGNKCPWENGGYLIVPIYPLGTNGSETSN